MSRAPDRAFAAAKAKAEQYARLSDRPLGAVIKVTEGVTGAPPQQVDYKRPAATPAAAAAVRVGRAAQR